VWQNFTERQPARVDERGVSWGPAPLSRPGTYDRAISRFLVSTIMRAQSWQELEALAHAYSVSFNHVHVSALVCRLPKIVNPAQLPKPESSQFSRFLREVSDLVTVRLSTFDPRAIANVLWAVSKLGTQGTGGTGMNARLVRVMGSNGGRPWQAGSSRWMN
jgi:hypothetical protein